jgi:hypothetical protein
MTALLPSLALDRALKSSLPVRFLTDLMGKEILQQKIKNSGCMATLEIFVYPTLDFSEDESNSNTVIAHLRELVGKYPTTQTVAYGILFCGTHIVCAQSEAEYNVKIRSITRSIEICSFLTGRQPLIFFPLNDLQFPTLNRQIRFETEIAQTSTWMLRLPYSRHDLSASSKCRKDCTTVIQQFTTFAVLRHLEQNDLLTADLFHYKLNVFFGHYLARKQLSLPARHHAVLEQLSPNVIQHLSDQLTAVTIEAKASSCNDDLQSLVQLLQEISVQTDEDLLTESDLPLQRVVGPST